MRLEANDFLVRQGDSAEAAFLIEEGTVEVVLESRHGSRILAVLGPGEIVGEMALVDGSTRTASVRARETCFLLPITSEQIDKRIATADPILHLVLTTVLERFRATLKNLEGNGKAANRILVNSSVKAAAASHLRAVKDFESALGQKQIVLFYQPIVDLTTGRISSFEALARWQHPYRGLIQPIVFIPLAEANGLSAALALHCIEQVSRDLSALDAAASRSSKSLDLPRISINVSGQDLTTGTLIEALEKLPHELQGRITLEVTETSLVGNLSTAADFLAKARALGFRIAVDDFGTGHSSYNYVRALPVDILKIDKAFIHGAGLDQTTRSIITSMVQLAASLDLSVVAEGIESQIDLDAVQALGCTYGQGYLFGRPIPLSETLRLLADGRPFQTAAATQCDAA